MLGTPAQLEVPAAAILIDEHHQFEDEREALRRSRLIRQLRLERVARLAVQKRRLRLVQVIAEERLQVYESRGIKALRKKH